MDKSNLLKISKIKNFLKNFRKIEIFFVVQNIHITFARILPIDAIPSIKQKLLFLKDQLIQQDSNGTNNLHLSAGL